MSGTTGGSGAIAGALVEGLLALGFSCGAFLEKQQYAQKDSVFSRLSCGHLVHFRSSRERKRERERERDVYIYIDIERERERVSERERYGTFSMLSFGWPKRLVDFATVRAPDVYKGRHSGWSTLDPECLA